VVDWTPDSETVFFVSNRNGRFGIFRQGLDEDIAEAVVTEGYGRNPRVTADGTEILYLGVGPAGQWPARGPEPVMRVSINGGASQQLFVARPYSMIGCAKSASGVCVIGEPGKDGKELHVSVIDPQRGRGAELFQFELVANDDDWWMDISPDGKRIAATRTLAGPIYILSMEGKILGRGEVKGWSRVKSFVWAADEKGFYVVAGIRNGSEVLHVDLQGHAHELWEDTGTSGEALAYPSPDGRHLAFSSWAKNGNMWMMEDF